MDKEILSLKSQITILEQNNMMLNNLNISMKKQIDAYLKQEKNLKISNGIMIGSISFNVITTLACIGEGIIIYNLNLKK